MRKSLIWAVVLAVVFGFGYFFWEARGPHRSETARHPEPSVADTVGENKAPEQRGSQEQRESQKQRENQEQTLSGRERPETARPETAPAVTDLAPTTEALREEVRKNPHRTPPSLVKFAGDLADRMSAARTDEAKASQLLGEFEDCLQSESAPSSVRTVCLANAGRLARFHPGLDDRYKALFEAAPSDIQRQLRSLGRLSG